MSDATLPAWIKKRDGRVVPFDPDAIGQDLFAAAEALGTADPFLTRELTDGVLHFLAADCPEPIPTTEWINDLVIKVVRELRQPRLAQAFAERSHLAAAPRRQTPTEAAHQAVENWSLENLFSRDLAAAHRDGLIKLSGLEWPRKLTGAVLTPLDAAATLAPLPTLELLVEVCQSLGGWLSLDGVEYHTLEAGSPALPRLLAPVLRAAGVTARLQLNVAEAPPWATEAAGPLFADATPARPRDPLHTAADIVQAMLALERRNCPFALDWHLSERDFHPEADSARGDLLALMARAALGEYPVVFAFDRPRRVLSLGPGLDRLHSYLLMTVDLDLPRLLEHAGVGEDAELFVHKLASLARLAVSAAVQKRHHLRESVHEDGDRSFLLHGFLLDRARLMVCPLGLDRAVRTLTGSGLFEARAGLDLARRIIKELDDALTGEGKRRLVDGTVDPTPDFPVVESPVPCRQQLTALGRLHGVTGGGTALVSLADEERVSVEQVVRMLEFTWRQTDVARLRFLPRPAEPEPTLLGWQ
jgi:hypothetical protein